MNFSGILYIYEIFKVLLQVSFTKDFFHCILKKLLNRNKKHHFPTFLSQKQR